MPHFPESFQNVVQRANVTPGNAAVWGDELGVLEDGGAPPGGSIAVTDGGTTVSPVTLLNFTSGATVTDAGGGEADVAISGGGSSAGPTGTLQASDGLGGFAVSSVLDDGTTVAVTGENISVEAGSGIFFNGASDSSGWTVGIYNRINTNMVGKATSLQFIVDDGNKGPDGFVWGNTANTSLMEMNGNGSIIIGVPTGLGKGFGSINAEHVYAQGTELLPGGGSVGAADVVQMSDGAGGFSASEIVRNTEGAYTVADTTGGNAGITVNETNAVGGSSLAVNQLVSGANVTVSANADGSAVAGVYANGGFFQLTVDVAGNKIVEGIPAADPSTSNAVWWDNGVLVQSGFTAPLANTATPASAGAAGTTGTAVWDASFIYICVATNTWKRAAISTW